MGWTAVRSIGAKPAEPKFPFPKPAADKPLASSKGQEKVVLAGGCFWGVEAVYDHTKGVIKAVSGYAGGHVENPGYEMVSTGLSGHAESVEVTFDPSQISFGQILMIYFSVAHDPTQLNRQGPDVGSQYRSAIFYTTEDQKRIATAYVEQINAAKTYPSKNRDPEIAPPSKPFIALRNITSRLSRIAHDPSPTSFTTTSPQTLEPEKRLPRFLRKKLTTRRAGLLLARPATARLGNFSALVAPVYPELRGHLAGVFS